MKLKLSLASCAATAAAVFDVNTRIVSFHVRQHFLRIGIYRRPKMRLRGSGQGAGSWSCDREGWRRRAG